MQTNPMLVMGQMLTEPTIAFRALQKRSYGWLPLALMMATTIAIMYWYYATVDYAWLLERTLSITPDAKPEQREAMAKMMKPQTFRTIGLAAATIMTPLIMAVSALYFLLAGKFVGANLSYGKWFSFACWTSIPTLLTIPLMAMQIMSSQGQLAAEDLTMVSLNYLVFHVPPSHAWASWLSSLQLTQVLIVVLTALGLRAWTGCTLKAALLLAMVPTLIVYGGWAAKIVLTS